MKKERRITVTIDLAIEAVAVIAMLILAILFVVLVWPTIR